MDENTKELLLGDEPGALLRLVAEWAATVVVVATAASVVFLIVLGCYSLVRVSP